MQVAGYKCLKEISRGPFTSLYLCRSKKRSDAVMVKILHPQYSGDPEISKRFSREAEFYQKLSHPNIITIHDVGNFDDQYFIVMEYVEGWPLDRLISQVESFSDSLSIAIVYQILAGLNYAHNLGITHRDIKPSNILISTSGVVKITDFGIARQADISAITEQGNMIGTPAYMAPELLRGDSADPKSDIFSVGVTWYEMIIGINPFKGDTIPESIHNVLNKSLESIQDEVDSVPAWVDTLLSDMLNKNVAERIASCDLISQRITAQEKHSNTEYFAQYIRQFTKKANVSPVKYNIQNGNSHTQRLRLFLLVLFPVLLAAYLVFNALFNGGMHNPTNSADSFKTDLSLVEMPEAVNPVSDTLTAMQQVGNSSEYQSEMPRPASSKADPNPAEEDSFNTDAVASIAAEKQGGFHLTVYPWAEIFVKDTYTATTPLDNAIMLDPGIYNLKLKNPAFRTRQMSIQVRPGRIDSVQVWMEEVFGRLNIHVKPWGNIYINDQYLDTTPLDKPIQLKEGEYKVLITNPYFQDYVETVEIAAGGEYNLSVDMQK